MSWWEFTRGFSSLHSKHLMISGCFSEEEKKILSRKESLTSKMVISYLRHMQLLEVVLRTEVVEEISSVFIPLTYIEISSEIYRSFWISFEQLINSEREFGQFIDKVVLQTEGREVDGKVDAELGSRGVEDDWEESCS